MNTISTAFQEWTRQVQLPGNISIDEATDILQTFGPSLSDANGNAWWDALSVEFNRLGIITPGTYVGLRNWANNNEQGANDLFDGLLASVNALPETFPVFNAIALKNSEDNKAEIDGNKARIEALKTGGTSVADVQFDTALDAAITALDQFDAQLDDEITSGQGRISG